MRGVRLIHTHLRGEPLTRDDLIDLAKLRLDLVGAILMTPERQLGPLTCAHLLPPNPEGEQWRVLEPISAHELQRYRAPDFQRADPRARGRVRRARALGARSSTTARTARCWCR